MGKIFFWFLIFYFIYKFIFKLVVPVGKAAAHMKETVKQAQVNKTEQTNAASYNSKKAATNEPSSIKDTYIDFEEIK